MQFKRVHFDGCIVTKGWTNALSQNVSGLSVAISTATFLEEEDERAASVLPAFFRISSKFKAGSKFMFDSLGFIVQGRASARGLPYRLLAAATSSKPSRVVLSSSSTLKHPHLLCIAAPGRWHNIVRACAGALHAPCTCTWRRFSPRGWSLATRLHYSVVVGTQLFRTDKPVLVAWLPPCIAVGS